MTSQKILEKAKLIEIELLKQTSYQRQYYIISKNFKWYECWSGALINGKPVGKIIEPPKEYWLNAIRHFLNMQLVADYLMVIYNKYVAIKYNSFYRTEFWNSYDDNGGSPTSFHLVALAGDTKPLKISLEMPDYGIIIAKLCPDIFGFKVYDTFVHSEIRNDLKVY